MIYEALFGNIMTGAKSITFCIDTVMYTYVASLFR